MVRLLPVATIALCIAVATAAHARRDITAGPEGITPQERQQLDQTIGEHLQDGTSFGDAFRAFHSCVSRAARSPDYHGVFGVTTRGQSCNRTSEALFQECMDIQHNKQTCFVIVTTASFHADVHAREK